MFSKKYNELFEKNLFYFSKTILKDNDPNYIDKTYTSFYPLIGKDYLLERNLLIIGQAPNSWTPKWTVKQALENADKYLHESIGYSLEESGKCPLEWVNEKWSEYRLYTSYFWNVSYKLIKEFYQKDDTNWNNIIAWSNLMKIAPGEFGNPDQYEIDSQINIAAELFKQELIDLAPKNVIILTNLNKWAEPILRHANIKFKPENNIIVEATARYGNSNLIITKRTYFGNHQEFVENVKAYLI